MEEQQQKTWIQATMFGVQVPDVKKKIPLEVFFTSETLTFELVPIIALLGTNHFSKFPELRAKAHKRKCRITAAMLQCFGYIEGETTPYYLEMLRYAEHECQKIKRDSRKRFSPSNSLTVNDLLHLWKIGAERLSCRYKNIPVFLQSLKEKIPNSEPWVPKFSHVARYILNGVHERYWYEENYTDIVALFPQERPRLICDLLAATSIRGSIESNVKEFFQALHQYHEKKSYDITIRIGKQTLEVTSMFKGFLSAKLIHLIEIGKGNFLCEAENEENGRKIKNFSKAMMGVPTAIPVDIWIMRAFDTDIVAPYKGRELSRSPTAKLYDAIHQYLCLVAAEIGYEPRQVSACLWAGIRMQTSRSSTTRFGPLLKKRLDKGFFADPPEQAPETAASAVA